MNEEEIPKATNTQELETATRDAQIEAECQERVDEILAHEPIASIVAWYRNELRMTSERRDLTKWLRERKAKPLTDEYRELCALIAGFVKAMVLKEKFPKNMLAHDRFESAQYRLAQGLSVASKRHNIPSGITQSMEEGNALAEVENLDA